MTGLIPEFQDKGAQAEKSSSIYLVYSNDEAAKNGTKRATVRDHDGSERNVIYTNFYRTADIGQWQSKEASIVAVLESDADFLSGVYLLQSEKTDNQTRRIWQADVCTPAGEEKTLRYSSQCPVTEYDKLKSAGKIADDSRVVILLESPNDILTTACRAFTPNKAYTATP